MKLIKGDQVQIKTGKDAGKTGKIERVIAKENKAIVGGANQFKRHVKARTPGAKSEIITITKPLPISALAIICQKCKKPSRIGFKMLKEEKIRICRRCGTEIKAENK